jgi:hypothetical protein
VALSITEGNFINSPFFFVLGTTLFLKKVLYQYFVFLKKNVRKGVIRGNILKITIDVAGTDNYFDSNRTIKVQFQIEAV